MSLFHGVCHVELPYFYSSPEGTNPGSREAYYLVATSGEGETRGVHLIATALLDATKSERLDHEVLRSGNAAARLKHGFERDYKQINTNFLIQVI